MLDSLSRNAIQTLYKDLDLKEFIETSVDSSYDGLCMLRPSTEHCSDRYYQDLFIGNTVLKFSNWDGEYSMFSVISSDSRYADETLFIPLPLVQKMELNDFRPWNLNSMLRHKEYESWEILIDYVGDGTIVVQDLETSQIKLRSFKEMSHAKLYTRYGSAPYPSKGYHGAVLTEEQAEKAGFPAGVIVPLMSVESNVDGLVMCTLLNTDVKFPYKELTFRSSSCIRDVLRSLDQL